jgi:hypothetical protein
MDIECPYAKYLIECLGDRRNVMDHFEVADEPTQKLSGVRSGPDDPVGNTNDEKHQLQRFVSNHWWLTNEEWVKDALPSVRDRQLS